MEKSAETDRIGQRDLDKVLSGITGLPRLLSQGERTRIGGFMESDERPQMVATGMRDLGYGLLLATDRRLIWLDRTIFLSTRLEALPYPRMTHADMTQGLLYGELSVYAISGDMLITLIPRNMVKPLYSYIMQRSVDQTPGMQHEERE